MRKATWSGLDGRVVSRRERKPRDPEPAKAVGDAKDEGAAESMPPAGVGIDPPSD